MKKQDQIREIAFAAMGLLILILGSKVSLHLGPVPISLQTFAVSILLLWLGPKLSTWVVGAYLIIGLLGVPVFAGGGGLAYLMKPSFGYLLGFLAGTFCSRFVNDLRLRLVILVSFNYGLGLLYLAWRLNLGFTECLAMGLWPTIWKDILLTGLAYVIYTKLPDTIKDRGFTYGNIRR